MTKNISIKNISLTFSALIFFGTISGQNGKISYGFTAAVNYSTIGSRYVNYVGEGNPTLSLFLSFKPEYGINIDHPTRNKTYTLLSDEFMERLTFVLQPTYTAVGFRQRNIDKRYNNYYLQLAGLIYFQPFTYITEITFFTGFCPSYLVAYSSEQVQSGFYTTIQDGANLNTVGRYDFTMPFGISVEMSPVISLELYYMHSFTNKNTDQIIQGRVSTIELGLKINAIGLANRFNKKEDKLRNDIKRLSTGSLLVMLPTPNPSEIKQLKADNNQTEIANINHELIDRNKKVMKEFRSYFNFCPVYFFMDTDAYKVVSKRFDNIFVNANIEKDPSIKTDSSNFFVASICEDISAFTTKHVYGLFVYDDKINQLPKPFNVSSNLIGPNLDGDPLNFFRKIRYEYSNVSFEKIITKFNNRLLRYKD